MTTICLATLMTWHNDFLIKRKNIGRRRKGSGRKRERHQQGKQRGKRQRQRQGSGREQRNRAGPEPRQRRRNHPDIQGPEAGPEAGLPEECWRPERHRPIQRSLRISDELIIFIWWLMCRPPLVWNVLFFLAGFRRTCPSFSNRSDIYFVFEVLRI